MLKVWITHFRPKHPTKTIKTIGSFFEPTLHHMQRLTCSRGLQRSFDIALCVLPPRSWPTAHSPARRNRLGWERKGKNGHITKYKLSQQHILASVCVSSSFFVPFSAYDSARSSPLRWRHYFCHCTWPAVLVHLLLAT